MPSNGPFALQVGGRGAVPAGARNVLVNVTVVAPDIDTEVAAYPCDAPEIQMAGSTTAHASRSAAFMAPLARDGTLCLQTSDPADVLVDVMGYDAG